MKPWLTVIFFLLSLFTSFGQNTIGIPDIINYSKESYNAGMQNWDMAQDKNGVVYFANNEGLLSFDGTYWKVYPLPNKSVVRSVCIARDNKIYVGGQDDFGYFSPDGEGKLMYTSLKMLLSEKNSSFTDIWDIISSGDNIFFRSKEKIFQLNSNAITVYPASAEWRFLGTSNNHVIAQDSKDGLLEFTNSVWVPFLKEDALPSDFLVTSLFPFGKDSSLIITLKNGFFILCDNKVTKFQFPQLNPFTSQRILACIPVNKHWIAVGTNLEGCYIINKKGEIIQNLSRKEGLQNNNIVSLFLDKDNNLWLGLDNGIDFIAYNNAIKHIYPEELNEGAGYSSIIYGNELYVGTSNGLYKIPISKKTDLSFVNGKFQPVPDTKGSSWGLAEINKSLLFGHHDGAFQIKKGKAIPITNHTGYWNFLPFYNVLPSSIIIAGNYNGLDFFQYRNNEFISKGNLPGFNESSQFVAIDNNNIIWVAHPYRGIYKIEINETSHPKIKLYTDKNGLPSYLRNHLFKVKNHIVAATEKGIYEYNPKKDSFEESVYFKNLFKEHNIRYLKEDAEGNIWFIEEKNLGVVDLSGSLPAVTYFPELNGKIVSGFEHINPFNKYNVFVGAEKGFYNINYEQYKKNHYKVQVKIRSVRAFGKTDSLLFGGYYSNVNDTTGQLKNTMPGIANNMNSFHFEYSSPLYVHQSSIEYSYYLQGFDKGWSVWSKRTEKDYTNLPAGDYTFQVKAKNNLGSESGVSSYSFIVLPPWYQTSTAYSIYVLLAAALVYIIYRWQRKILRQQQKKHEEEQRRLQYLHQLELEKSEKEIIKLKNEKLEAEIEFKNMELASTAMHLVQKGELLANIKDEIVRLKNGSNGNGSSDYFKKMLHILNEETKTDKDWEHFAVHFDKVHSDFLRILKTNYPNLSAHELKLCAYLRMNLSSKEIAQLENISVRGVEISRYRLRKKFQISTETNLFDFLLDFSS
jgi:ligand-binding sensor domain-containing protein/DNA-binding CsgD family transcriptional regulator